MSHTHVAVGSSTKYRHSNDDTEYCYATEENRELEHDSAFTLAG